MTAKLTMPRLLAAVIVVLSAWIVHDFAKALLAACMTAIASWPLYTRSMERLPRWLKNRAGPVIFTFAITVFALAPMVFACVALLREAHSLLQDVATAGGRGIAIPGWLVDLPVVGHWLDARWQQQHAHPGALQMLTQDTDSKSLLGWVHSLAQFTFQNAMTVIFTVLLLAFLYQEGAALAREAGRALRLLIGERAGRYMEVGTRAVRASVNSMLVVGLFDGLATAVSYAAAGVPRPLLWAGITGVLAAVPFLGYAAVAAMALQLVLRGAAAQGLMALVLGCAVLLGGDKLVRPLVAREGMRLPFVWVLMGCIGGFDALGLAGLVIGPAVLSLGGELWAQRVRDDDPSGDSLACGTRTTTRDEEANERA